MNRNLKIPYLESLRGIAALTVAIFHFDNGSVLNNSFTKNGWLMVDFFFILSGFVISLNYQSKMKNISDVFIFQFKRFVRLYPLHLIMLIVFLGIELTKYYFNSAYGIESNTAPFLHNNLKSFVFNIFLVQNLFSDHLTWNTQSWSISSEFYTYLIFSFLALYVFKNKYLIYLISLIIVILSLLFIYNHSMETKYGFVRCLYSFFLGLIIFNLSQIKIIKFSKYVSYILFFIVILLVSVAEKESEIGINMFIPMIFGFFILTLECSKNENYLKKMLDNKYFIYLGTISYGIYMVHTAVWWTANQMLRFIFNFETEVNSAGAIKIQFENYFHANLVMFLGLIIIIAISHLSYKYIERSANKYKNKISLTNQ